MTRQSCTHHQTEQLWDLREWTQSVFRICSLTDSHNPVCFYIQPIFRLGKRHFLFAHRFIRFRSVRLAECRATEKTLPDPACVGCADEGGASFAIDALRSSAHPMALSESSIPLAHFIPWESCSATRSFGGGIPTQSVVTI